AHRARGGGDRGGLPAQPVRGDGGRCLLEGAGWTDREVTITDSTGEVRTSLAGELSSFEKVDAFVESVREGTEPPATAQNAFHATALTEATLAQIEKYNPAINAVVTLNERAPEEARRLDQQLADGEELAAGAIRVRALLTPGHTPGSTCLLAGKFLFSGDTLFPGGPGRTNSPADLQQSIQSITSVLFALPDETEVLPGHGDGTTIGAAKSEYAVFAGKEHPADLCGDVNWAES
ncbi:MAG: MBL fold metallo-hydrolase, partial [Chloroflexi bacterium]|nr:MBL fold metallo-hydrolase [Chloroflexota bacterium]